MAAIVPGVLQGGEPCPSCGGKTSRAHVTAPSLAPRNPLAEVPSALLTTLLVPSQPKASLSQRAPSPAPSPAVPGLASCPGLLEREG